MTTAQFRVLRACFEVCDRDTRRVSVNGLARHLGCALFNAYSHLQRLMELGMIRREGVGRKCVSGIYILTCSFLIFED